MTLDRRLPLSDVVRRGLAATARAENAACVAVVQEYRAFLAQHAVAEVALKLCDELAARIELRALLTPKADEPEARP